MKTLTQFVLALAFPLLMTACQSQSTDPRSEAVDPDASANRMEPGLIDITATGLVFEAPDEIPAGWTTFRFHNTADVVHFAVVERLPDGIGEDEHQELVAPVFQVGMDFLNAGQPDSAFAAFGTLPEWFGEIVFFGGPGLTSPGQTSETTLFLEPGRYLLECYAKTDGNFHSFNANPGKHGMVHQFTVTADTSSAPAPTPDLEITLSSERGIEADSVVAPGVYTVAVHFEDQMLHENFVGHDVHLARINEETNLEELGTWIDWSQPAGLQEPAPAEFLGGAEEMPAGNTEYFTVTLEPGTYAWISEVTNPTAKNMLKTFTVANPGM